MAGTSSPRFVRRRRDEDLFKVEMDREAAKEAPEALRHVGWGTFESDEDERYYLSDAAEAIAHAVEGSSAARIVVELTLREIAEAHVALDHVASDLGDWEDCDERHQRRLRSAARSVREVAEANAPSSGPRR